MKGFGMQLEVWKLAWSWMNLRYAHPHLLDLTSPEKRIYSRPMLFPHQHQPYSRSRSRSRSRSKSRALVSATAVGDCLGDGGLAREV